MANSPQGVTNFSTVALDMTDMLTATAGGGQANALGLKLGNNVVTTVATAADSVALPAGLQTGGANRNGMEVTVMNQGANAVAVFPATGGAIGAGAANASVSVPAGKMAIFRLIRTSAGADLWAVNLSA